MNVHVHDHMYWYNEWLNNNGHTKIIEIQESIRMRLFQLNGKNKSINQWTHNYIKISTKYYEKVSHLNAQFWLIENA